MSADYMTTPGERGASSACSCHATIPASITPAQARCLAAYARTGSRKLAAAELGITEHGVWSHLSRAYERLGVQSAIDAFRALGWLHVPDAV